MDATPLFVLIANLVSIVCQVQSRFNRLDLNLKQGKNNVCILGFAWR